MAKVALLIGVSEYEPELKPLPAAPKDVEAMQRVLAHPEMGGFDEVKVLINPDPEAMQVEIETMFKSRKRDDLVLLFFSGHGVKDESGRLYFATRTTRKNLLRATAVPASFVHDIMNDSRSKRQVVILDCCFSGAFAEGLLAKDDGAVDVQTQLGGEGRVVLTSSTSTQYSFEEQGAELSVYTRYLIEGIETGTADRDNDGLISVDELHEYAKQKVQEAAPAMKPKIYAVEEGFKIRLAKAASGDPKLIYRKQVERFANHGEISQIGRRILDDLQESLRIPPEEATAIASEVLKPFQEYQQKLQRYEQVFREAIAQESPLSQSTRQDLQRYREILGLRERDVAPIEAQFVPQNEEVTVTETTTNLNTGSEQGSNRGSIPALQNFRLQLNRPVKLMAVGSIMLVLTVGGYQLLRPMLATIPISLPFASPAGFSLDKILSPVPRSDIMTIAFSPDGKTLATGGYDYTIALWDLGTGKERKTLEGHKEDILSVAFSPDGKTFVSGSRDFTIKIWNLVTGKVVHTLSGHTNGVLSVAISPDGKTLASGDADQALKIWDLGTGKLLATLQESELNSSYWINSLAFSPDGQTLASKAQDDKKGGTIKIWKLKTQKVIRTLEGPGRWGGEVKSLVISPDGKTLASGDDQGKIKIWNLDTGELLHTLIGDSHWINSVAINPDGKTLASGGDDRTINIWNLGTGELLGKLPGHSGRVYSVAFGPDGKTLASASSGEGDDPSIIKIWQR
jgi:WD40 repeat protein/uncharacterized caspase-like protein